MAESTNGVPPGEEEGLEERPASVGDQPRETVNGESDVRSTSRWRLWLALLLIIAALPSGWFLLPESTRQRWTDMLMNSMPLREASNPEVALTPSAPPTPKAATLVQAPTQTPAPRVTTPKPSRASNNPAPLPAATSEEVKLLIATMEGLKRNMQALQNELEAQRQEFRARQQLELRTRLRWIASPETLLPQMVNFWQDIASLPLLSKTERSAVKNMQQLALNDTDKLNTWSTQLKRMAATLPVPDHQDLIPKLENPAFSWLSDEFHLWPVSSPQQRSLSELRTRLLNTAHALTVEIWPEPEAWQRLLADLREQLGDDAQLALPEHLDGIRKDITTMRTKAANWLEKL